MDQCSKSWQHDREKYPRDRKISRSSFSQRTASEGLQSVQPQLSTFPKLRKERIWTSKDFKASVERSERVTRRRKVAIEQQKQKATKKRKLLEQSGDRICDLHFESGSSTSETTEEQLSDGMDTDNFCDGQGAKCKTKEFAHSSTQREPQVAPTTINEGTQTEEFEYLFERTTKCGFTQGCRPSKCSRPSKC